MTPRKLMTLRPALVSVLALVLALSPASHGLPANWDCATLDPRFPDGTGGFIFPQSNPSPYVLTVQPKRYNPGDVITVSLENAGPANRTVDFREIILQVRSGDMPVGSWGAMTNYSLMDCSNAGDTLVNTNNTSKAPNVPFQWTAPSPSVGTVEIWATVAFSTELFWTRHSAAIIDASTPLQGGCISDPCINGLCFASSSDAQGYVCICDSGFEGQTCDRKISRLYCPDGTPCGEQGLCFQSNVEIGTFICICESGYHGSDCTEVTSGCTPYYPCQNGGRCFASSSSQTNYFCLCVGGYSGTNCEVPPEGIPGNYDLVLAGNLDPPGIFVAPTDTFNFTLIPGFDNHEHVRRPVAIDYDPVDGMVYWTDLEHSSISRAFLDGTGSVILLTGLEAPDGLALDVQNRVMYWTDTGSDLIERATLDGRDRIVVLNLTNTSSEAVEPRAIVLDATNGHLYWTDWGSYPRIERANVDGTGRVTLVDSGLQWPNGLSLDLQGGKLYWCDAGLDVIESTDLLGQNRRLYASLAIYDIHPFDIWFYNNSLFWTDWRFTKLLRLDLLPTVAVSLFGSSSFTRAGGLHIHSDTFTDHSCANLMPCNEGERCRQFSTYYQCVCKDGDEGGNCQLDNPCSSAPCNGGDCFLSASGDGYFCQCPDRYSGTNCEIYESPCDSNPCLNEGTCLVTPDSFMCICSTDFIGTRCEAQSHPYDLVFVADLSPPGIFVAPTDTFNFTRIPGLDSQLVRPVAIDYDPVDGMVYWSDVANSTISRAFLDGTGLEVILTDLQTPDGLSLDLQNRVMYWTDTGSDLIERTTLDGQERSVVLNLTNASLGAVEPRAIIVDPINRYLYWTDWGSHPKIERSGTDGSGRTTLVDTALVWPNGLALDLQGERLYWCDASADRIEYSNLLGQHRTILVDLTSFNIHPFDIAIYNDYVYWTDWISSSLLRADVNAMFASNHGSASFGKAGGLHIYQDSMTDHSCRDLMPCQHGGHCRQHLTHYECICLDGFAGVNCQDDNEYPNIRCPANITMDTDVGESYASVTLPNFMSMSDNAGIVDTWVSVLSATYEVGDMVQFEYQQTPPYTVIYHAVDDAGNEATCDLMVTITDVEKPNITCPADITMDTDAGESYASVTLPAFMSMSDNVAIVDTWVTILSTTYEVGDTVQFEYQETPPHTVIYNAVDHAGNEVSCQFTVTVADNEDPFVTCPVDVHMATDARQSYASVTLPDFISSSDNVGVVDTWIEALSATYEVGNTVQFEYQETPPHTVIYYAIDHAGNQVSCEIEVTVTDREDPSITCPDNITMDTSLGESYATVTLPDFASISDNVGVVDTWITALSTDYEVNDVVDFEYQVTPPHTVVYHAVDHAGNEATCQMRVTVTDNENPNITCPADITMDTDAGESYASVTMPDFISSSDNVGVVDTWITFSASMYEVGNTVQFAYQETPPHTVVYHAVDDAGNEVTCPLTVTVMDDEDPSITCPVDITVNKDVGESYASVTLQAFISMSDNVAIIDTWASALSATYEAGDTVQFEYQESPYIVVYHAVDHAGNEATCQFTVTVADLRITCPAGFSMETVVGESYALVTLPGLTNILDGVVVADTWIIVNGSQHEVGDQVQFEFLGSPHTVTYHAVDTASNEATCTMIVTVSDAEDPSITCPADFTVNTDPGEPYAVVTLPDFTSITDNVAVMDTGINIRGIQYEVGDQVQVDGTGSPETLDYYAMDLAGNIVSCQMIVTVTDVERPQITDCPSDVVIPVMALSDQESYSWRPPIISDNSGHVNVTFGCLATSLKTCNRAGSGLFSVGVTMVTYNATDMSGNENVCAFTVTVTVVDIVCPADVRIHADPGSTRSRVNWPEPDLTGWNGPTNFTSNVSSGAEFAIGTHTVSYRQWFAVNNLILHCSFLVEVIGSCPPSTTTDDLQTITWPATVAGQTAESFERCTLHTLKAGEPIAVRNCSIAEPPLYFQWEDVERLSCGEERNEVTLDDVQEVAVSLGNAEEVAEFLANQTSEPSNGAGEVNVISNILENIVDAGSGDSEVTEAVVETVNNVITNANPASGSPDVDEGSASAIVQSVETQVSLTLQQEGEVSIQQDSIHVKAVSVDPMEASQGLSFVSIEQSANQQPGQGPQDSLAGTEVKTFTNASEIPPEGVLASVRLPSNIVDLLQSANDNSSSKLQASFIVYADDTLFQSALVKDFKRENGSRLEVGGSVVSLTVENIELVNLTHPVVIEFRAPVINETERNRTTIQCVFWDFSLEDNVGDWSTVGCTLAGMTDTAVSCNCSHATNFAILVDVKGQKPTDTPHQRALDIISQVGGALSIIALAVTLIIYLSIRKLRTGISRQIFIHFCFSLLMLYIVFLAGVDNGRGSGGGCVFVAALLHYLTLSTMMWMAVEARNMYVSTVKVFPEDRPRYMLKACLAAWGSPLIILTITLAAATDHYDNEHYCFLRPDLVLFIGLLTPIGLILIHNIITFVLVMRSLLKVKEASRSQQISKRLQNAIGISALMGLTWCFGFLAIDVATFAFQLIFCLANSFQGVVVCIMFCVRRDEVRTALAPYMNRICCGRECHLPKRHADQSYDLQLISSSVPSSPSIARTERFDLSISASQ